VAVVVGWGVATGHSQWLLPALPTHISMSRSEITFFVLITSKLLRKTLLLIERTPLSSNAKPRFIGDSSPRFKSEMKVMVMTLTKLETPQHTH
jgi:hypothetical protein